MNELATCKLKRRCTRAREERMCHSEMSQEKPEMGNGARECEWRPAPEAWAEDLARFKKLGSWELDSEREGSTFGAHWGQTDLCARGATCIGDRNASTERLCISLPYVETFNSKVIKGFVPELRNRYVFFVFRDSYVLRTYVMNIPCTFPIFMYGYVITRTFLFYFLPFLSSIPDFILPHNY